MNLVIIALAVWRVSSLLAQEDGPYNILARFRKYIGIRYTEHPIPECRNEFARMIACMWCNSVWVGMAATVLYMVIPDITVWLLLPLAFSTVTIVIEEFDNG